MKHMTIFHLSQLTEETFELICDILDIDMSCIEFIPFSDTLMIKQFQWDTIQREHKHYFKAIRFINQNILTPKVRELKFQTQATSRNEFVDPCYISKFISKQIQIRGTCDLNWKKTLLIELKKTNRTNWKKFCYQSIIYLHLDPNALGILVTDLNEIYYGFYRKSIGDSTIRYAHSLNELMIHVLET